MKLSDFLRLLNDTFNSNELEALAGSGDIQNIEVTDELAESVKEKAASFLTLEAAKNNPELEKHFKTKNFSTLKGELLGNVDTGIQGIVKDLLGEDKIAELDTIEKTKDKVKWLGEEFKKVVAEKSNDEKMKKLVNDYKLQVEKANQEIEKTRKEKDEEVSKFREEFNSKLLNKEFHRYINDNYQLAEPYAKNPTIKKALYNEFMKNVADKANLLLDDEGNILVRQKDNPDMDYFINGSKKGELKDLLDPAVKDYLKVSEPPKTSNGQNNGGQQQQRSVDTDKLPPMLRDRVLSDQNKPIEN